MIDDIQDKLKKYREEKLSAVKARQVRINNWISNEQSYNGQPVVTLLTRSNLHIPKMFEAVQVTSSKIGKLPEVDYESKPEGDLNATELMKAMWHEDIMGSGLDDIYQMSKIEGGLYGRAIYKMIPSNDKCSFELVDTMSYLIAPTARKCVTAIYQGQQFIYKTINEIEDDADEFGYDEAEMARLKADKAAAETSATYSQEKSLKDLRLSYLGYANVSQLGAKMVELTEWYTTLKSADGKKSMHVMTVANDVYLLRCVPIKEAGLLRPPFVSAPVFPRGVVFWTPGIADVVRDPNLAMDVTINQLIDNNTYRNFGMMFVSSSSGLKQSSIVPRPLGVTPINVGLDKSVKDSVWQFTPPEIGSATQTLQVLNGIAENAVGLSATPLGHKGKQTVTQQSSQSALIEARSNLIKQNFISAIEELAQMYADNRKEFQTTPRKIKIYGYKQITLEGVTKKNFVDVEFIAKASAQEINQENKAIKQKASQVLFEMLKDDKQIPGQRSLREQMLKDFDRTPDQIDQLLTQDTQPQLPQAQPGQPPQPAQPGQPTEIPANPENPQLSANGQATAQAVPNAIQGIK